MIKSFKAGRVRRPHTGRRDSKGWIIEPLEDEEIFTVDLPSINIMQEQEQHEPEFTGILTSSGNKLYRYYPEKVGIGFLAPGVEDYDPDVFSYGEETPNGPLMRDDLLPKD